MLEAYLKSLTDKERVAMEVAKRILGSSFNLERSIGYLEFKKKYTPPG
jgi:hypothetical protein